MRKEDLGKVRTTPITELKCGNFGHVYKKQVRVQEKHIDFIVHDSIRPTKQSIPENRVELKESLWKSKGIKYQRLG